MAKVKLAVAQPTLGATYFGTQASEVITIATNPRGGFKYTDAMGGDDTVYGGIYGEGLIGNLGNDMLYGGGGGDVLSGGAGNDLLDGGAGSDTASYRWDTKAVNVDLAITTAQNTGGSGIDTVLNIENLEGTAYSDKLYGDAGANYIYGGTGNNLIDGRSGNDYITAGVGNDTLLGGAGDDYFADSGGSNRIDGGLGQDTLDLQGHWQVRVDLALTTAQIIDPVAAPTSANVILGIENLITSGGDSVLLGDDAANVFSASNLATVFTGMTTPDIASNDLLDGRGGNDTLNAGSGNDTLTGGTGADSFMFDFATYGQNDTITDFNAAEGDKICVQSVAYGIVTHAHYSASDLFTGTAAEFHITGAVGAQRVEFDFTGDKMADEVISVTSAVGLTLADFIL